MAEEARAYFGYSDDDRALLAGLGPVLEDHADDFVDAFYRHLLSFEETREFLRDPAVRDRLLRKQREYLLSLAGPKVDEVYLVQRRRIGEVHERIGLEPRWYLGAYAMYASLLAPAICEFLHDDPARAERTLSALYRLLLFDAHLALDAYIERREQELAHLNRELANASRQLTKDFEHQGAELRGMSQRAESAERLASIATLVAGLAHEIGTPMGVIQGHAKLLEPAVQGEQAKWRLDVIQEQVGRISRIIESLLNMARPTGRQRQPLELAPLIEATLAFLTEKLKRRGIHARTDFRSVPSVAGDPERLQQMLLNLLLNACDAMPEGGDLTVSLAPADEGVLLVVRDTGGGIQDGALEQIFDPFFTTKAAGEGNGLGLAVVHGIVSDHGGGIDVETGQGGTEFRIQLPGAGSPI